MLQEPEVKKHSGPVETGRKKELKSGRIKEGKKMARRRGPFWLKC